MNALIQQELDMAVEAVRIAGDELKKAGLAMRKAERWLTFQKALYVALTQAQGNVIYLHTTVGTPKKWCGKYKQPRHKVIKSFQRVHIPGTPWSSDAWRIVCDDVAAKAFCEAFPSINEHNEKAFEAAMQAAVSCVNHLSLASDKLSCAQKRPSKA